MEHDKLRILAAFDLETTGLNPVIHDVIEIAIVPLTPDFGTAGIYSKDKSRPSGEGRSGIVESQRT